MDKVYVVLIGKGKDIKAIRKSIKGANAVMLDLCRQHDEQLSYDDRGIAYTASGEAWIHEADLED